MQVFPLRFLRNSIMYICLIRITIEFDKKCSKYGLIYVCKHGFYRADFHETQQRPWSYFEMTLFLNKAHKYSTILEHMEPTYSSNRSRSREFPPSPPITPLKSLNRFSRYLRTNIPTKFCEELLFQNFIQIHHSFLSDQKFPTFTGFDGTLEWLEE
jgi:hypothetical protein